MKKHSPEKIRIVYSPEGPSREGAQGTFLTLRLMARELIMARELVFRLFSRDFSARYRQSLFGLLWVIFMPVIAVMLFLAMNRSGILNLPDVGIPYALYGIIGLTLWNFFAAGLAASSHAIVGAGSMAAKINFPKVALVIGATGQCVVELMIRMVLIILIFFYFGMMPHWSGLLASIFGLVPLYLLMLGVGFFLSLVTTVVRDITNLLNLLLMAMMFLTPVVFPMDSDTLLASANVWNPLNYLVNVPRDLMVRGETEHLTAFVLVAILSALVFIVGWRLFYLAQSKVTERI